MHDFGHEQVVRNDKGWPENASVAAGKSYLSATTSETHDWCRSVHIICDGCLQIMI